MTVCAMRRGARSRGGPFPATRPSIRPRARAERFLTFEGDPLGGADDLQPFAFSRDHALRSARCRLAPVQVGEAQKPRHTTNPRQGLMEEGTADGSSQYQRCRPHVDCRVTEVPNP